MCDAISCKNVSFDLSFFQNFPGLSKSVFFYEYRQDDQPFLFERIRHTKMIIMPSTASSRSIKPPFTNDSRNIPQLNQTSVFLISEPIKMRHPSNLRLMPFRRNAGKYAHNVNFVRSMRPLSCYFRIRTITHFNIKMLLIIDGITLLTRFGHVKNEVNGSPRVRVKL